MDNEQLVVPAIAISLAADLGSGRGLTLQTHVHRADTENAIDSVLDKIMGRVDRQKAKYEIPDLQDELAKMERAMHNLEEDAKKLYSDAADRWAKAGHKGEFKPGPTERSGIQNCEQNIKRFKDGIEDFKKKIEMRKALIA